MKVVGLRCTKDTLDWIVLEGTDRTTALPLERHKVAAPAGPHGSRLTWVRQEVLELLARHAADVVGLRVNDPGGQSPSLERSEVEGVVQQGLHSQGVECERLFGATVRSRFKARTAADLDAVASGVPLLAATAKTRRDPVFAALAVLPARSG